LLIIQLIFSLFVRPKVITWSCFYCSTKNSIVNLTFFSRIVRKSSNVYRPEISVASYSILTAYSPCTAYRTQALQTKPEPGQLWPSLNKISNQYLIRTGTRLISKPVIFVYICRCAREERTGNHTILSPLTFWPFNS